MEESQIDEEPRWGPPIPPTPEDGDFEQLSQLFMDTYGELTCAMNILKKRRSDYVEIRQEQVDKYKSRYSEIVEKHAEHEQLLTTSLELLKDYQETIEELCEQTELYTWLNSEKLVDLQKRLLVIIKEYQEQLFKRPEPLTYKQKYFIGMFLEGQCTDGYMATKLGISMEEAKAMIEQYKQEEIRSERR